jgi:hypothetical protein
MLIVDGATIVDGKTGVTGILVGTIVAIVDGNVYVLNVTYVTVDGRAITGTLILVLGKVDG